jgi:hypothetical protein
MARSPIKLPVMDVDTQSGAETEALSHHDTVNSSTMARLNMSMNEDQRVTQDLSDILPIVTKYEV